MGRKKMQHKNTNRLWFEYQAQNHFPAIVEHLLLNEFNFNSK
jgi:hypothetical protein